MCQPWIRRGERSGLLTRIATTESVSLCKLDLSHVVAKGQISVNQGGLVFSFQTEMTENRVARLRAEIAENGGNASRNTTSRLRRSGARGPRR